MSFDWVEATRWFWCRAWPEAGSCSCRWLASWLVTSRSSPTDCGEIGFLGRSRDASRGRARDIGEYAQDLAFLIDHLGLECPAVLGVSFGGAIALEFAAEHPHRLGCTDSERC